LGTEALTPLWESSISSRMGICKLEA